MCFSINSMWSNKSLIFVGAVAPRIIIIIIINKSLINININKKEWILTSK
jgi:hypothetical protein